MILVYIVPKYSFEAVNRWYFKTVAWLRFQNIWQVMASCHFERLLFSSIYELLIYWISQSSLCSGVGGWEPLGERNACSNLLILFNRIFKLFLLVCKVRSPNTFQTPRYCQQSWIFMTKIGLKVLYPMDYKSLPIEWYCRIVSMKSNMVGVKKTRHTMRTCVYRWLDLNMEKFIHRATA